MYENSCSYDLKRGGIKEESCSTNDWPGCAYRFACNSSTFEQLKQSVEKAKAALVDRGSYLAASSAFSDLPPFSSPIQDPIRKDEDKRSQSKYLLNMAPKEAK